MITVALPENLWRQMQYLIYMTEGFRQSEQKAWEKLATENGNEKQIDSANFWARINADAQTIQDAILRTLG